MSDVNIKYAEDFIEIIHSNDNLKVITEMRKIDGYINATKMCIASNKQWRDYFRNKKTQDFLKLLSKNLNLSIINHYKKIISEKKNKQGIIQSSNYNQNNCEDKFLIEYQTGYASNQGTFVHPKVAINLASWCSPEFDVLITELVCRYISGEITTEESRKVAKIFDYYAKIPFAFIDSNDLISKFNNKTVIYFIYIKTSNFEGIKFGVTTDIDERFRRHMNEIGRDIKLIKIYEVLNYAEIENLFRNEMRVRKALKNAIINNKNQTELVQFFNEFSYDDMLTIVEKLINDNKHPIILEKDNKILELEKELESYKKNKNEEEQIFSDYNELKVLNTTFINKNQLINSDNVKQNYKDETKLTDKNEISKLEANIKVKPEITEINGEDPDDKILVVDEFIQQFCEFGIDDIENKKNVIPIYRVDHNEIYYKYKEFAESKGSCLYKFEFEDLLASKYKCIKKPTQIRYEKLILWYNIRLKDGKCLLKIYDLVSTFLKEKCIVNEHAKSESTMTYKKFVEYAKEKNYTINRNNGFSAINFNSTLKMFGFEYKRDCIPGPKKCGYLGFYLKDHAPPLFEMIKKFTYDYCELEEDQKMNGPKFFELFMKYANNRWQTEFISSEKVYKTLSDVHSSVYRTLKPSSTAERKNYNGTFYNIKFKENIKNLMI